MRRKRQQVVKMPDPNRCKHRYEDEFCERCGGYIRSYCPVCLQSFVNFWTQARIGWCACDYDDQEVPF